MEEPVRILNLFTIMDRGGAETMVMNYYRKIDRTKVQFDFMVHREQRGAYDDEIEALGGRIFRMCPIYPQNFSRYKKMLREFFNAHPEYKIIHSHMSELGCYAFKEAQKHGIKVKICHAHNAPVKESMSIKEKGQLIFRDYFKKEMLPYSDHLFVCGEEAGNWLYGEKNKNRFVMMNNAVDAEKFRYSPETREKKRGELGVRDKFVILNVGRFNLQKNHTFILDIFEKMLSLHKDSVLLLAGAGPLENEIKEKCHSMGLDESVKFLGLRDDVHEILQSADVFLFPSLYEGLPVTMVEAQSSGIKCFISDVIPQQCVLTDDVHSLSLDKGALYWAEQIATLAQGYARKDRYDDIVKAKFDITENAAWLCGFYLDEHKKAYGAE